MILVAIHIARIDGDQVTFLASKSDTSSFGFLEKKPVRELSDFLARQILPKTQPNVRNVIRHGKYLNVSLRWGDGLAVCCLTDNDYPPRVAFELIGKVSEAFREAVRPNIWKNARDDNTCDYKSQLKEFIHSYKNPETFDSITKTQHKVDVVKDILHRDVQQVLGNYDQIEKLLESSNDISAQSELMFKTAKKTRKACCAMQ